MYILGIWFYYIHFTETIINLSKPALWEDFHAGFKTLKSRGKAVVLLTCSPHPNDCFGHLIGISLIDCMVYFGNSNLLK